MKKFKGINTDYNLKNPKVKVSTVKKIPKKLKPNKWGY